MRRRRRERNPVVITDAAPSFEEEQRRRKRTYAVLMVVHLVGFTAAGLLAHHWVLALMIIAVTGALPWFAVVLANDRSGEREPRRPVGRGRRALGRSDDE
ncbi:hypothetical protein GCM10009854_11360 [Saccharopolyspora halophila]|uniref:DUF3099 domain-containing protein n=1 Tax=Saccharopolyspora halophila TaxID=405551 RepID=A0ABN3FT94_9PSEU